MLNTARTTGVQTVVINSNSSNPQVMWYSTIVPHWPVPPVLGPRDSICSVSRTRFSITVTCVWNKLLRACHVYTIHNSSLAVVSKLIFSAVPFPLSVINVNWLTFGNYSLTFLYKIFLFTTLTKNINRHLQLDSSSLCQKFYLYVCHINKDYITKKVTKVIKVPEDT